MVPLLSSHHQHQHSLFFFSSPFQRPLSKPPPYLRHRRTHRRFFSPSAGVRFSLTPDSQPRSPPSRAAQPPRTLFPGGFKRPEISVPSLVIHLDADDVLGGAGDEIIGAVDRAVARWVGAVVLNGGAASAGGIYEAACKLKAVVRDRAYLLVGERVDIAAAANASGVVLSDQGLPVIVARKTLMDSKSESVVLPLVARKVESPEDALNAATSEGADFLIYSIEKGTHADTILKAVCENVKIPIFVMVTSYGEDTLVAQASNLLKSGASGLVTTVKEFEKFGDDRLSSLFNEAYMLSNRAQDELDNLNEGKLLNVDSLFGTEERVAGFINLEDWEKKFIERERSVLLEAINVIKKAAPLMEEVSLLVDAVSQIDEPFLLAIVGEFNSGKSSFINALLGSKFLKEGVVPTTNEITFLRYSNLESGEAQRCERHPDGQFICYLPAPILKEMNIVDTPGTNVILQRQQRLTEEFVPRADLLLFVISADRPLTESEVVFLRYIQQWKKKVVFILNKSDLYRNSRELEEAITFIEDNTRKLLNSERVTIYPVSARTSLEAKLSASKDLQELAPSDQWKNNCFDDFENYLYSFLDGSTSAGMERMKLKLETPVSIAERLLSSCETLVRQDCRYAKQDLLAINDLISSVKDYATKMESESISWRRKALLSIDRAKARALDLVRATLQLSNLDVALTYVFKGENTTALAATSKVQNDVIGPALKDVQTLVDEYVEWLQSNNAREGKLYQESFEKSWPSFLITNSHLHLETFESLKKIDELSLEVIREFSGTAASKSFEQEIREAFLGTFGGLGVAGLSASLLISVLPTTLEDLLALSLCSVGGFVAISNFPARRQAMIEKVKKSADVLAQDLENAMQKDLSEALDGMERFVNVIAEPYRDAAQRKLEDLLGIQAEILNMEKELQKLQVEIQNLHVS